MKRTLLTLALAIPLCAYGQDLRVNEVMPPAQGTAGWVELYNTTGVTIDASTLQLCSFPVYLPLSSLPIVSGDLNVPADGYLVVEWEANGGQFLDTDGEVGLYTTGPFSDPANMLDYMQFGSAGHTRESVAATAGLWTVGEFGALPDAGFTLSRTEGSGASAWGPGHPTPGAQNQLATNTDRGEHPDGFVLHGAYPNPFNPSTAVRFDLAGPADVVLDVYDLLGQRVRSIEVGLREAGGGHEVRLDAAGLGSGTYLYRLVARSATDVRVRYGAVMLVR